MAGKDRWFRQVERLKSNCDCGSKEAGPVGMIINSKYTSTGAPGRADWAADDII